MARFMRTLRDWARMRMTFLTVFAVIGFVVAGTVVVIACCTPPLTVGDGMAGGDGGKGGPPANVLFQGKTNSYNLNRKWMMFGLKSRPVMVTRNGDDWILISNKAGVVEISDPNGNPAVVIVRAVAKGH
jgi:hypothetical protein